MMALHKWKQAHAVNENLFWNQSHTSARTHLKFCISLIGNSSTHMPIQNMFTLPKRDWLSKIINSLKLITFMAQRFPQNSRTTTWLSFRVKIHGKILRSCACISQWSLFKSRFKKTRVYMIACLCNFWIRSMVIMDIRNYNFKTPNSSNYVFR